MGNVEDRLYCALSCEEAPRDRIWAISGAFMCVSSIARPRAGRDLVTLRRPRGQDIETHLSAEKLGRPVGRLEHLFGLYGLSMASESVPGSVTYSVNTPLPQDAAYSGTFR